MSEREEEEEQEQLSLEEIQGMLSNPAVYVE
jgi:hypothetical protein